MALLSFLLSLMAVGATVAAVIVGIVQDSEIATRGWFEDYEDLQMALGILLVVLTGLSLLSLFSAMAAAGHVREGGGHLRGGAMARLAFILALGAGLAGWIGSGSRFERTERGMTEASEIGERYWGSLLERNWEEAYGLLSESFREHMTLMEYCKRAAGRIPSPETGGNAWIRLYGKGIDYATFWIVWSGWGTSSYEFSLVRRNGKWRVSEDKNLRLGARSDE